MTTQELLDRSEFERWLDEARLALRAAGTQAEVGIHNWACFLAEQAAQLAVKGLLHAAGRGPWGHDLVRLGAEAAKICEGFGEMEPRLLRLSRHYIPARYPDAHAGGSSASHYGPEDSAQALDDATAIERAVEGCWKRRDGRLEDESNGGGSPDRGSVDEGPDGNERRAERMDAETEEGCGSAAADPEEDARDTDA